MTKFVLMPLVTRIHPNSHWSYYTHLFSTLTSRELRDTAKTQGAFLTLVDGVRIILANRGLWKKEWSEDSICQFFHLGTQHILLLNSRNTGRASSILDTQVFILWSGTLTDILYIWKILMSYSSCVGLAGRLGLEGKYISQWRLQKSVSSLSCRHPFFHWSVTSTFRIHTVSKASRKGWPGLRNHGPCSSSSWYYY